MVLCRTLPPVFWKVFCRKHGSVLGPQGSQWRQDEVSAPNTEKLSSQGQGHAMVHRIFNAMVIICCIMFHGIWLKLAKRRCSASRVPWSSRGRMTEWVQDRIVNMLGWEEWSHNLFLGRDFITSATGIHRPMNQAQPTTTTLASVNGNRFRHDPSCFLGPKSRVGLIVAAFVAVSCAKPFFSPGVLHMRSMWPRCCFGLILS